MTEQRVLVVDDEPQILRSLRVGLTGHGYEVATAPTGEAALDQLRRRVPDVVILDLVLPGISGIDVCRQLHRWSPLPIIVLSAKGEQHDKMAVLDSGADDYLTKPFGMGELLARIRVALRHGCSSRSSEPVVEAGNLTIDLDRHTVTVSGGEVHLTPREYELFGPPGAQPGSRRHASGAAQGCVGTEIRGRHAGAAGVYESTASQGGNAASTPAAGD